jgi:hypothetical protein
MHLAQISKRNSFIKDVFTTFQMPFRSILENKLLILKHYTGFSEEDLDNQSYFIFEEYIKIINDTIKEEAKKQEIANNEQEKDKNLSNINPSKVMGGFKSMSNVLSKFKKK